MPYLLFTPYHLMSPPIRTPPGSGLFLAAIYNQSQLAKRKQVARYWSISAVPVSAHPSPLVITSFYNEISGSHIGSCRCSEEGLCRPSTTLVTVITMCGLCVCAQRYYDDVT